MKKLVIGLSTAALALASTGVFASGHGEGYNYGHHGAAHGHDGHATEHSSPYYVVLKGLMTTGDKVSHGAGVTIDGNSGAGFGLDFGYKINHNFAIELVTSYAGNKVTETVAAAARTLRNTAATTTHDATTTTETTAAETTTTTHDSATSTAGSHEAGAAEHSVRADANYLTYGLSLAYTMHVSEKAGLLFKVGYEGEKEKISALNISSTNYGLTYAAGVEFKVDKHYEVVFEYEGSRIKGPRGSSLFAGLKYNY